MNTNTLELQEPIDISNAGIIILAPYLNRLFTICGLINQNVFVNEQSKIKAMYLLEYAATGKINTIQHEMIVNKLLCGISFFNTIKQNIYLT